MKREEAMQILQLYKDELEQRIDEADGPDVKDVYRWQMDGFDMAIEALSKPNYETDTEVRLAVTDRNKDKVVLWDAFGEVEYYPHGEINEPTQTHGRLIDADALSKKLCETTIFIKDGEVFQRMINDAPTVQADRSHGEWVTVDDILDVYICDQCGEIYQIQNIPMWHFCPNCGADMRKEKP